MLFIINYIIHNSFTFQKFVQILDAKKRLLGQLLPNIQMWCADEMADHWKGEVDRQVAASKMLRIHYGYTQDTVPSKKIWLVFEKP